MRGGGGELCGEPGRLAEGQGRGRKCAKKKGRNGLFPLEEERQIVNGQVYEWTELDSREEGPEMGEGRSQQNK